MLSAEKISKSFGPQNVLKDISLILGEQERIGIVGINGAGKSTLTSKRSQADQDLLAQIYSHFLALRVGLDSLRHRCRVRGGMRLQGP